ncbi:MAG: tripartite tricarboxylate transporter TctB family protein [Atribacterota bacterium]|nr:tripartite tricarboxylate transporter TctB family protein [Atribacterota bacterium]MDD4896808.1 tripartite tricarboxylate transporter TctB family protein [Atribacterota bacterium]MDD5659004.1 tripartite tricarboxylate transporter TctB family protein [Actinomycetota bacterium]
MKSDVTIGILVSFLGIMVLFFSQRIISGITKFDVLTPHFFPTIIAICLIVFGLGLSISNIINYYKKNQSISNIKKEKERVDYFQVLKVILLTIVYIFFIELFGFILTTIIVLGLLMYLFGERKLIDIVIVSIVTTSLFYYFFVRLFNIALPTKIFLYR